ncbi:hypothetical protein BDV28DRAFT_150308 [Aspergillus coremiiformis]|uniref:Cyanovirin-N domain-containing protein n=1 Tax=Aspergillus coremiiformis TaxID=138285 RepID=A0A5N6Z0A6_9EURO|nr:hypothetical protein BDV28DRAFT_150308 [Aspergillus coremiiformis]
MYQTLIIAVLYLSAWAAGQGIPMVGAPARSTPNAGLLTQNLHTSCTDITIENNSNLLQLELDQTAVAAQALADLRAQQPPSNRPALRRPARRAQPPAPLKPRMKAKCTKRGSSTPHEATLPLDYCLGWSEQNRGQLIAQDKGYGLQKGGCDCQYIRSSIGRFRIRCLCQGVSGPKQVLDDRRNIAAAERIFNEPGVIQYDASTGRLFCFGNYGT